MYRKFRANSIFTGYEMVTDAAVLITEADGAIVEIIGPTEAGENIEQLNGILCPGFVNAHCHIELSHLQGRIPQHTGLMTFVQQVIQARNRFSIEEKLAAMQLAEQELWQSGTMVVGDICNTADSLLVKEKSKLQWHNFIEVSGFVTNGAKVRHEATMALLDIFKKARPAVTSSMAAHAPYSVSPKLFQLVNESTSLKLTTIHNQESAEENKLYQTRSGGFLNLYENLGIDISGFNSTGKTSMQSWLPYFSKEQEIICVHNTFTSLADLEYAAQYSLANLHFCICLNANLYIENALPPVEMLAKNARNVVIGTDSYASNTQLNMMAEIKSIKNHFPTIAMDQILRWATINGAAALRMDDIFGSFEKGKRPGVVLIDDEFSSRRIL